MLCVKIEIRKSSDRDTAPARFIEFRADSNILSEIGESVKIAFESETSEDFLETLPPGRLRDKIYSLNGQPGKKRIKLDHLDSDVLLFEIVRRKSLGVNSKDYLLMEGIEHSSLVIVRRKRQAAARAADGRRPAPAEAKVFRLRVSRRPPEVPQGEVSCPSFTPLGARADWPAAAICRLIG